MTQLTIDTHVADIVTALPQSADLFRNLRIDFCCGGKIALKEAAEARDLNPIEVLNEIKAIEINQGNQSAVDPATFGNKTLVAYIQEKYHECLREELPTLSQYVSTIVNVHGDWQPHLYRIQEIFDELSKELLEHTEDEDKNVFPLILEFLGNPQEEIKETVRPHVFELEEEHENAGKLLFELRDITNNFTLPEGACATYSLVYARLEQLEKDTFNHVHLENNVLFDRVRNAI
ncbi:iron-sulfur cluster repair di-iron protein [Bacillus sp. FJAT-49711]|uniref:iron-sulfur cluster repair di-iron protein n=1 Tax=Bacillus sp. FJAT-49711 TaxID=2833585 RepID=UPI001BC98172|nr:iron-sulfur cluster repair di-iron protein [Bacillus sp. FJAT-49711]MBS4220730.1 iron-sulfur cluster repair di-iron protein [Bacillus sp. FJAT-49711]